MSFVLILSQEKLEGEGEICEWEKLENDCIATAAIHTIQQTQGESLSQRFTLQSLHNLKVTETREFACNRQEFPIIQITLWRIRQTYL